MLRGRQRSGRLALEWLGRAAQVGLKGLVEQAALVGQVAWVGLVDLGWEAWAAEGVRVVQGAAWAVQVVREKGAARGTASPDMTRGLPQRPMGPVKLMRSPLKRR